MTGRSGIVALGLALAVSGCASEGTIIGTAPDGTPIYGRSFAPTSRDGAVTLSCIVKADMRLADCQVVSEQPEGQGLGAIAMATVGPDLRMSNADVAVGSRVQFTVRIRED